MVRPMFLVACGVVLLGTLAVATQLQDIHSNYFPGHSGSILVTGTQPTVRDTHAVLLDSSRFLSAASAPSSLPLESLVRVLSRTMGLTEQLGLETPAATQLLHSPQEIVKKTPKAQVIFNVESVGKTTVDRFQLNALSNPSTPHISLGLSSPPITPPAASISVAASVATGSPVSSHGIVGARWKSASGVITNAYSRSQPKDSFAAVSNLADLVASHTDGRGLTISASGSESLAWAFGVNKALADERRIDGWTNNFCLSLVHSGTLFQSVSSNSAPALDFQVGDLEKQMESSSTSILNNLGDAMHAKVENHVVSVSYSPLKTSHVIETVKFDLKQKADVLFLAELQYALDLPSKLKQVASLHAALQDDEQDLIVFSFAGFTALLEQYGRESEQFKGALKMFNQLFPLLSSEYANLFTSHPQAAMQSLVLLGSHQTVLEKQDPRQIEAILKADNQQHLEFYPNLYVSGDVASVCAKLNKDLAAVKYTAYCPSVHGPAQTHMLVESHSSVDGPAAKHGLSRAAKGATTDDYPTQDQIERYQIVLWFSILFALVLLTAVYSLANMSFKKDTMLYSSFNPNWEDRKRR